MTEKAYTDSYIRKMPLLVQRKVAESWIGELRAQGKSERTISVYMQVLCELAKKHRKPFDKIVKADLVKFLGSYANLNYRNLMGTVVKAFLKWLYQSEEAPDIIRWWKPKQDNRTIPAESMLTQPEIKQMLSLTPSIRDRCILSALYDSGCRLGELIPLNRENISFTEQGCVLTVSGKTGTRRVLMVNTAPLLRDLLNALPNQPKINLWTGAIDKELDPSSVRLIVKKAGARINRDIHPHLLRHSRASHLALKMSETGLRARFGWRPGSSMPKLYVHVSGRELDNEFLKAEGVKVSEATDQPSGLAPISCSVCGLENDASFSYCAKCGSSLLEGGDSDIEKFSEQVSRLVNDPQLLEMAERSYEAGMKGVYGPHLEREARLLRCVASIASRQNMILRAMAGLKQRPIPTPRTDKEVADWAKAELASIKRHNKPRSRGAKKLDAEAHRQQ